MAFYGAYVMVVLTMISYSMPLMRGKKAANETAQKLEIKSFWMMTLSMVAITLLLTGAGIMQVYMQRYSADPEPFMIVQDELRTFYWLREVAGFTFLAGLFLYIYSFFAKGKEVES
jgi:nitric oxide reductase subunit B